MAELKRVVGPWSLVAVGAAGMVGSSYLYLTSKFFTEFGLGGTIVGMVVATFFAACMSLAIAELSSMFPRAGGELVYSYVAFNRVVGFFVGWLLFMIFVGIVAFYVSSAGFLLSIVIPGISAVPLYTLGGGTVYLSVLAIGVLLMLIMLGLNWFGAALSFGVQLVLFLSMVLLGAVIVIVAFSAGSFHNFWPVFSSQIGNNPNPLAQSVGFILPALGFLTGFSLVAVMAEEAKVSARRIGMISVIAVAVAGAYYTVLFIATGWVIPWEQTAQLESGAIDTFAAAGFPVISWVAFIVAVLGVLTTFLAVFSTVARLVFSMARAGLLPEIFAQVDEKTGAPRPALLFTAVVGFGLGLVGPGGLVWLLSVGGVNVATLWVVTAAAFFQMRYKYPDLERPYRVRFNWLPALAAVVGVALLVVSLYPGSDMSLSWPAEYILLGVLWVLGLAFYFFYVHRAPADSERELRELIGAENYRKLEQASEGAGANQTSVGI